MKVTPTPGHKNVRMMCNLETRVHHGRTILRGRDVKVDYPHLIG